MWVFWLLALCVSATRERPLLKPGRNAHATKLKRTQLSKGRLRVGLSLSSTETIELQLEPNHDLFSPDYEEIKITADGHQETLRRGEQIPMCWFRGKVVGDPNSQVIASDCNGFEGVIRTSDGKNHIAKAGTTSDDVAVYLLDDEDTEHGSCGVHDSTHIPELVGQPELGHLPGRRLLDYNTSVNVVEIALVSDYYYVQARGGEFGHNLSAVGELNSQLLNLVQATYAAANFAKPTSVRLRAQYFFSQGDPYSVTLDGNGEADQQVLLGSFTTWAQSNLPTYDHIHLLTYYNLQGSVVGFAHTASACSANPTAISMASSTQWRVANTISHELGHVLGMSHDSETSCNTSGYLMDSSNSCPDVGLCPFSSCSISSKDAFAATTTCLFTWNESTCSDGKWNGDETGLDCGGSCPLCTNFTGCLVNNGGCEQNCTATGPTAYECSCDDTMYLSPLNGQSCIADVDQCLANPCQGSCTNLLGPGGVFTSFMCSCPPTQALSLTDGLTCGAPSCFDRIKNQDEVMVDCGGVCARSCNCLISTASWHFGYDRGIDPNGAQWQSTEQPTQFQLLKAGLPVRYLYAQGTNQWIYDNDLDPTGYYGIIMTGGSLPPSGVWNIYNGSQFVLASFSFRSCAAAASTCGNGVLEGAEACESCLLYSGGKCLKPNPCCDSTCTGPRPQGLACTDKYNMPGACWNGGCVTRGESCGLITSKSCFGMPCLNATGGGECGGVVEPAFTSTSCNGPLLCFIDCVLSSLTGYGAIRGFPCSSLNESGYYSHVCDGGVNGDGLDSVCTPLATIQNYLTASPTQAPTTHAPTLSPTTHTPTPPTTAAPTQSPTTTAPSPAPTLTPTAQPAVPTTGMISGAETLAHAGLLCISNLVLFFQF